MDAVKYSCVQIKQAIDWGLKEGLVAKPTLEKGQFPTELSSSKLKTQREENNINRFFIQERDTAEAGFCDRILDILKKNRLKT